MQRNVVNLSLVLGILFVVMACVCPSQRNNQSTSESNKADPPAPANRSTTTTSSTPSTTNSSRKTDNGDFIAQHETVSNSRYLEIDKQIKQEKLLERAAEGLNQALILPHDLYLKSKDCGEVNAFYKPDENSVTVCYELMEQFFRDFKSNGYDDKKAYGMMFDATRFVFLHEVGHALIDVYKLPITANEEDAADRCSSFINLEELGDDGVKAVLAAAEAFQIENDRVRAGQNPAADAAARSEWDDGRSPPRGEADDVGDVVRRLGPYDDRRHARLVDPRAHREVVPRPEVAGVRPTIDVARAALHLGQGAPEVTHESFRERVHF
jgi:hypothetical protein